MATRKPIPAEYQIHDRRFLDLIVPGAELRHLHDGGLWAEGPVYLPDSNTLLWSDVRRNRCMRLDVATGEVSLHMQPANFNNGHTRDAEGRVIACEHGTRSVVRFEPDGTRTVLADRFEGKRFNSPNDVVVASDGGVWFTDPDVRHRQLRGGVSVGHRDRCLLRVPRRFLIGRGDRGRHRHGAAERSRVVGRRARLVRRRHRTKPRARRAAPHAALRRRRQGWQGDRWRRDLRHLSRRRVRRLPSRRRRQDLDERSPRRSLLRQRRQSRWGRCDSRRPAPTSSSEEATEGRCS